RAARHSPGSAGRLSVRVISTAKEVSMPAQATALSPQALTSAAKAPILAYNDKDWDRVRASITPDFVYDEVGTRRKLQGADEVIAVWQGWAQAFPDSKATFHGALVSGNSVVLELTWKGSHKGQLQTPQGPVAATGKPIEIRACTIIEVAGEKAKLQRHYFDMATLLEQLGVKA
ncbi:MAG: ester cyclase, partial [Gemmatimonadales bacterium]